MSDVVFRRIKGRIVPIKLSKSDKQKVKDASIGTGLVAAGLGVAATGGQIYKAASFKAANVSIKAFKALEEAFKPGKAAAQGDLFEYASRKAAQDIASKKAFKSLNFANKVASTSKFVKAASPAVGAGIITAGALKALNAIHKEKRKNISPELVAGGSAAAAFLAPRAHSLAKDAFTAGQYGKQGIMDFGGRNFNSVAPKIKGVFKHFIKVGI